MNLKGEKSFSLAFQYDHTDRLLIRDQKLIENAVLKFTPSDKDESNWQKDDGRLARKDINNVTTLLCLGKSTSKFNTRDC